MEKWGVVDSPPGAPTPPPSVGYVIEVRCEDGHKISLSVPDAHHIEVKSALHFPGKYSRPTLHVLEPLTAVVRQVVIWPDIPTRDVPE